MDKLDYLIVAQLHKDASMSFVDIAKNINSTSNKVRRRYEKMKKEGKIFCSAAIVDLAALGYQGKAFLLINVADDYKKSDAMGHIMKIKNIIGVSEVLGSCDLVAIAFITDITSIQTIIEQAKNSPGVHKVDVYFIDDTYFPICPNFNTLLNQRCQSIAETL
jgi:DNA-binding Lrp family transcriptional regulator